MTVAGQPRAAIIGAGLMGRWHADAVRRIGGRVMVIVDPNDSAREALRRRHPEAQLTGELDPDAVARLATAAHVCTPPPTHATIMRSLIEAGLHALTEKPFTDSAETTAAVLSLAKARGVVACPVHQFLFQDGVRSLLEWLPVAGTVRRVEFSTCSAGAVGADAAGLDGLVADILPHPLALVSAVLGSPLGDVSWQVAHPTAGEFRAVASIGATVVDIGISAHGRPTENVLRVVTDAGSVTADLFHGFAVRHDGKVSRRAKIVHPFVAAGRTMALASANLLRRVARAETAYPGLRELVRRFYSATRGERPIPIGAAATADVAAARDVLLLHLRSGRRA